LHLKGGARQRRGAPIWWRGNNGEEKFVTESCGWLPGWNHSPGHVKKLLHSQSVCVHCEDHADIRAVVRQYRMGISRWWVVNNSVVVPIWIVELLKKTPEL
jgi:hypothetical protein